MKIALVILGVLVAVIAIVAIVGVLLPRDHVASVTATIPASRDKVWQALTDVAAFPTWRSDVRTVEVLSTSPLTWRETGRNGSMTLAAEVSEPPRRLVGRIQDQGMPFGGAWEYQLEPDQADSARTRITITERGWVSNPIFRFVSKFVMGHYSTLEAYTRALGRKFGADVTPTRV
jgi:uncharacterized protein YndB with AHSA1/START domain